MNSSALVSDGAINISSTLETRWGEDKQENTVMSGYKSNWNESGLSRWRSWASKELGIKESLSKSSTKITVSTNSCYC